MMRFVATCVLITPLLGSAGNAQTTDDDTFGTVVNVPAFRPEMEPDRTFAGNYQAVLDTLRGYFERGAEESATILAELEEAGLDRLAPPFLMEYARRQWLIGDPSWSANYGIGKTRMMYDRLSCTDRSASPFQVVIETEFSAFGDFISAYNSRSEDEQKADMKVGLESGKFFNSGASAWWICSHGMASMTAAFDGRALELDEWWVGADERDKIRAQGEAAFRSAFGP